MKNIAAVMVTADLPAFERPGLKDRCHRFVNWGRCKSPGRSLVTNAAADGNVYAVAQGALVLGGFSAGNDATRVIVNHSTVGRIANGATIERPVTVGLPQFVETLDLELDRTDFTNVGRVAPALNDAFGRTIAAALAGKSVRQRPLNSWPPLKGIGGNGRKPKRFVNEWTGTMIIGSDVTVSPVSISEGGLSFQIETQFNVSQAPLRTGRLPTGSV